MNMYADNILDHYKNPRNFGTIGGADARFRDFNPLCGDEIEISLKIEKNRISDIRFSGHGCAISQASVSMLTEEVRGKTLDEVKKMRKQDVLDMLGIDISAVRLKCALLGFKVLKTAVYEYLHEKMDDKDENTKI